MNMEPVITLEHITKIFRDRPGVELRALKNITLEILPGEFFVIVGPSGSGKSTLLRIMSGLETPSDGTVQRAPDIAPQEMSFVFQHFALLPWLTAAENIAFGLHAQRRPYPEIENRVNQTLTQFGLEKFRDARPRELSGGMRQRIGIARAFVTEPRVLFMDEPFSELDSFTAQELRQELLEIWRDRKPTIIMVTHMIEEALELADRIAVLTPQPSHIKEIMPNVLPRPRQTRSPEFYRLYDAIYQMIKP